jgi:hypothetical protein
MGERPYHGAGAVLFDYPNDKPRHWNLFDEKTLVKHGHFARGVGKNHDRYIDKEVCFLRHAISTDKARTKWILV